MYRVLIADDEYWVGRWLADVLAKSPYDIKLAGISKNGGEALEKLKSDQIDILITDINMPVASGLALLKELEESGRKKPKTIIISGYDEFEYARQAIELDVLAYLLKPRERETVYEAVEKAIGLLEEEQRQRESETSDFAGTVEVVLAEYLKNPESDLKEKLAELFVRRKENPGFYRLGLLQTGQLEQSALSREPLRRKMEEACPGKRIFLHQRDRFTWAILITGIEHPEGFAVNETALASILHRYEFGLSRAHDDFSRLDCAVEEAKQALIGNLEEEGEEKLRSLEHIPSESELHAEFLSAIQTRSLPLLEECSRLSAELFVRRDYDLTGCLNFYFVLTGDVIKLLNDCYGKENDTEYLGLMEEGYELSVRIKNHYSIRSICKRFEDYTRKVISCLKEDEYLAVSDIVRKVLLLIREKYAQDLSLGQIADEYGVNPSYFSKKFKDETGCNFIDYLTAVRMEQARALLENTALPVAAVSSRVGFREAKYFSRVFSSVMGMKPTEYRERMRRDGTGREVEM